MSALTIQHASGCRTATAEAQEEYVTAMFKRGGIFIGMTEVGNVENPKVQPLLREAAEHHGYRLYLPGGYGEAIAVRQDAGLNIRRHGYKGPFVKGRARQYPARGCRWVTVDHVLYGRVTYIVWHANPADNEPARRATNLVINRNVAALARRKGKGTRLVFASADTNVDDATDKGAGSSTKPLYDAGLVSCWDALGKHPGTDGSRTIDVIYHSEKDARVRVTAAHRFPLAGSDHHAIEATYSVAAPR